MRHIGFFLPGSMSPQKMAAIIAGVMSLANLAVLNGTEEREDNPVEGKDYSYLDTLPKITMLAAMGIAIFYTKLSYDQQVDSDNPVLKWLFYANVLLLLATLIKADILFFQDGLPRSAEDLAIEDLIVDETIL